MINVTAQARICFGSGFDHHGQTKHTTSFLLEGQRPIFDVELVDEASIVVMRPNDPQLKTTRFHLREVTPTNGTGPTRSLYALPKERLYTTNVTAFAVVAFCHNPLYENLLLYYSDMYIVALFSEDLRVNITQYHWK